MSFLTIDPADVGATGLAWLLISYGYVLFYASNLISEGSDLLLLIPSLAGLVGGVVLPLLGAVPDGAIMLFSGLGDIEKAQETLSVGVGALAGSTIMLLTVPWGLCVYYGRVDFSGPDNLPNYKGHPKLREGGGICATASHTGVSLTPEIHLGAKMMMLTTLPYFLIQVPAFFLSGDRVTVSAAEHNWALAGFIVCFIFFVMYMYTQVKMSNDAAHKLRRMAVIKESLRKGRVSLSGALSGQVQQMEMDQIKRNTSAALLNGHGEEAELNPGSSHSIDPEHMSPSPEVKELLKDILGEAFRGYDQDHNGTLSRKEFSLFLTDFHESVTPDQVQHVFDQFDRDSSDTIDYDEFLCACYVIIKEAGENNEEIPEHERSFASSIVGGGTQVASNIFNEDEAEGEEEEEVPEDLTALSPDEQQKAIKRRAFGMLFIGTALVLLFSDPMVDVLSEVAVRLNIPAFYVSFILAPPHSHLIEESLQP